MFDFSKCFICVIKHINSPKRCNCRNVKEFLWLEGKPINYDPVHAPNSQDLPNVVALNFGVTVVRKEDLIKNSNIIGKNPQFVITSDIEAIDIDTPLDFYIAEQLYKKTEIEKKGLLE
jgi:N-acylneuraminate cytidylyltransferase